MTKTESATISEKILAHVKLLRPLNLAIGAFAVFSGAAIAGELRQSTTVLFALLLVVCYNAAANALNDFCDYEIDRINRPGRPLVTGLVKRATAQWVAILLFIIGSLLSIKLNWGARLLALGAALPMMAFYTPILKGLPLLGNFAVALILGLAFLFTGAAVGNPGPLVIPALLAFGLTLVRELVKDIADVEGDAQAELKTLPLVMGTSGAIVTAINLSFLMAVATLLPFIFDYYGIYYLIVSGLGVILPLAYIIYLLARVPEPASAARAAGILKAATLMGVVAIYVG